MPYGYGLAPDSSATGNYGQSQGSTPLPPPGYNYGDGSYNQHNLRLPHQSQQQWQPAAPQNMQQQQPPFALPPRTSPLQQNIRYSPDPLQYHQQPPTPHTRPSTQASPPYPGRSHSQATPQQALGHAPARQVSYQPAGHGQWQQHPGSAQHNASVALANGFLPQQYHFNNHQLQSQAAHSLNRPAAAHGIPPPHPQSHIQSHKQSQFKQPQSSTQSQQKPHDSQSQSQSQPFELLRTAQHQPSRSHSEQLQVLPAPQVSAPPHGTPHLHRHQAGAALLRHSNGSPSHLGQAAATQSHPAPVAPTTINPSLLQHRIPHVDISTQRKSIKGDPTGMPQSPKRRKSNDGLAIPVCQSTGDVQSKAMRKLHQAQPVALPGPSGPRATHSTPSAANVDYQAVLLSLSDEYINAAYNMSAALAAPDVDEADMDQYHALLSTGMGCLDSVLKNYHISDSRKEARIRLRLASLLHEETENDVEAEDVLVKGLALCERAKLVDLKYAMHHLMARIWSKGGRLKTAIKSIEKAVAEVEKLSLLHWVYAFRFLRVTLGLRAGSANVETVASVKHLTAISQTAAQNEHIAVQFAASTLESLVHLRSRTADSIDLAQRAIATARSHQLSSKVDAIPQVRLLVECVDLGCSLALSKQDETGPKTQAMQANMDALSHDPAWNEDGSWCLPVSIPASESIELEKDSAGVFKKLDSGEFALTFQWLARGPLFTLGFLLSGLAAMYKNSSDKKAEMCLEEGFKMAKGDLTPVKESMGAATARDNHQAIARIIIRLYVVFVACGRAEWTRSLKGVSNVRKDLVDLQEDPDEELQSLTSYLEAICKHGMGDLKGALSLYRSPELKLDLDKDTRPPTTSVSPIKVLAGLNSVPIMRHLGEVYPAEMLLYRLKPYCLPRADGNRNECGSKAIEAVFYILKATEPNDESTENPIMKIKAFLQSAVTAAKSVLNNQLLCVVMNVMTDAFFHNIVGDQAEKSARAGRSLARKIEDLLWTAVSDGMYMDVLERCGKRAEARQAEQEAQSALQNMPGSLKEALYGKPVHE